jgi:hypothetical protein
MLMARSLAAVEVVAVAVAVALIFIDPPPYPSPRRGRETLFHGRLRVLSFST